MSRPERGRDPLHGLTGAGPSKVGVSRAMRARDVSRADEEPDDTDPGDQTDAPPPPAQTDGGTGRSGSSPVDS